MRKLLVLLSPLIAFADPCNDIVHKVIKPPPAVRMLDSPQSYALIDAKERYELMKAYRQDIQKLSELLGKYIQLRKYTEETNAFLGWKWKRVEVGIEYKKDVWKEQIEQRKITTELLNIQRQLLMLGVSPADLEACYKASR